MLVCQTQILKEKKSNVGTAPWVRRALDGFLAVFPPRPKIRRNHLSSSWPAARRRQGRNTHHLLHLIFSAACMYIQNSEINSGAAMHEQNGLVMQIKMYELTDVQSIKLQRINLSHQVA